MGQQLVAIGKGIGLDAVFAAKARHAVGIQLVVVDQGKFLGQQMNAMGSEVNLGWIISLPLMIAE